LLKVANPAEEILMAPDRHHRISQTLEEFDDVMTVQ
jgi:hypothetical protein